MEQRQWSRTTGWRVTSRVGAVPDAQVVVVYGSPEAIAQSAVERYVARMYPEARVRIAPRDSGVQVRVMAVHRDASDVPAQSWEAAVA